jgi:hypothetical protein
VSPRFEETVRVVAYPTLVGVSLFHALSAVRRWMVVADGLFTLVVGGTQTLASVRLLQRAPSALLWSAVAGFGMLIYVVSGLLAARHRRLAAPGATKNDGCRASAPGTIGSCR